MIEIPLTRGCVAIIDDEDYERVSQFKWHARKDSRTGIMRASRAFKIEGKYRGVDLGRFILDLPPELQPDHINRNGLDNRRCNLRAATIQQNAHNRWFRSSKPGLKGVCYFARKYQAYIYAEGRKHHLGCYSTAQEAADVYDAAAIKFFGEFACLNRNYGGVS